MYLEKLPQEDNEFRKVYSIAENPNHTLIDVAVASDLLCAVEQYDDWLRAFQEYYNQKTGGSAGYRSYDNVQIRGMLIPADTARIDFRVDWGHTALKFRVEEMDECARDIVYGFLERLIR